MSDGGEFAALLLRYRPDLLRHVRRRGAGLLRFESDGDLVQGVHTRALGQRAEFEVRGDKEFLAYLYRLADAFLADRHDYWSAAKRGSGNVLRLTLGGGDASRGQNRVPLPASASAGPATFASRREALVLAARAIAVMPDRDGKLVRWMSEGVSIADQAAELELSYDATQRAGLRAVERFRRTYAALVQSWDGLASKG